MQQWLIGIKAVDAALTNDPDRLQCVWLDRKRNDKKLKDIESRARNADIPVRTVDSKELDQKAGGRHQGVAAEYAAASYLSDNELLHLVQSTSDPLILVLDHLEDPRNFGACLRSAGGFGVTAVVIPKDRAVSLTPSARKAAAGAAEYVPVAQVTNLARTLDALKDAGCWVTGLFGEAEQSLDEVDLTGSVVVILGNEGKGVSRLIGERCDFRASIPMDERQESLNVSVATGIALYEASRQRLKQRKQ